MHSRTGFRKAKFIPRLGAKFENGSINSALKTGLPPPNSADGETSFSPSGSGGVGRSYPVPGVPIEEEIKTRFAHDPMKDEKRIFLDHTSWRSCHRGMNCSFAHCMMPTENFHWLIKAQLAKRGGRKSHVRIAPDAVPGYIAALRETNVVGDGKVKRPNTLALKPKSTTPQRS